MIKAIFDLNDKKVDVLIQDHAGAGENGHDLVCASASTLTYTIIQNVTDYKQYGFFRKPPKVTTRDGYASIVCYPKRKCRETVLDMFRVIERGFQLLEHNFPDNVEVKSFGNA